MATLAVMKARIETEIVRDDLTDEIAAAITTAISIYQSERFRFSDINPTVPITFPTVAGRDVYTSADNAHISTMFRVDYILALIGNMLQPLDPDLPQNIMVANQSGQNRGQPMVYAYEGNQLRIGPMPDQAYTITLGIFRNISAPATDDEVDNPWMTDAEELIRSRAKHEIALHVTRNEKMQKAMSPHDPGQETMGHAAYFAWQRLKRVAARITGRGRVRAMQF